MDKKGVSGVITVILLVLLVLASIVLLWNIIIHVIGDKGKDISSTVLPADITIVRDKTNFLTEPVKITITRGAQEMDYSSLKAVFYNASSSYTYTITENLPQPLETKTYYAYLIYNNESRTSVANHLVNSTHFSIYIAYRPSGSSEERIAPGSETYNTPGTNCKTLSDKINSALDNNESGIYTCGILDSRGNLRSNPNNQFYDPLADLNNDKNITSQDLEIFKQHNGDETWCKSQLSKSENPCSEACTSVYNYWYSSLGSKCTDTRYSLNVDFNKDGSVDGGDYSLWDNNQGSELCKKDLNCAWCQSVAFDTQKIDASTCLIKHCLPQFCETS